MKDRTEIWMLTIFNDGRDPLEERSDVLYDTYDRYEDLPPPCKCEEIKREFEAWKEFKKGIEKLSRLEKQVDRFRK